MYKMFEIGGSIEVSPEVTEEEFSKAFISFIESKNWMFGGGWRMIVTHEMSLKPEPFEFIERGKKTIELRLNDEKRRNIKVGDRIDFTQTETGEILTVEVVGLHQFKSFRELYSALPLLKCGYSVENIATAKPEDMDMYYSKEQQEKYGVLGIEIKIL